jgi:hypothetical protein
MYIILGFLIDMFPPSLRENMKSRRERTEFSKKIWSPSQKESPYTKLLRERESNLRTQPLLSKFLQIQIQEPSPREAERCGDEDPPRRGLAVSRTSPGHSDLK